MSRAERDLVEALRAEVAGIDPSRPCDRRAESAGLEGALIGRRAVVDRLLVRLRRSGSARAAAGDGAGSAGGAPIAFDWDRARDHCRTAWLRGRFLARGSLSLASGRTHLEFVVEAEEAPILAARVAEVGLPGSWRIRRGRGVVTWKSAETVGTFLRQIGAAGALLELEARQVSRALRGELNRVLNAESANLHRAVGAAGRQLAAIDELESDGRLGKQPYTIRLVAHGRRETPEATLGELADRLSLHRSAVQRALERIEWLVLHDDGGAGRRGTARRRTANRRAGPSEAARPTSGGWRRGTSASDLGERSAGRR